jgi:hypothetical protein
MLCCARVVGGLRKASKSFAGLVARAQSSTPAICNPTLTQALNLSHATTVTTNAANVASPSAIIGDIPVESGPIHELTIHWLCVCATCW